MRTSIQRRVCYLPTDFGLLFGQQEPVSMGSAEWTLLLGDLASFNSQKPGNTTLERSTDELLGVNLQMKDKHRIWQKHVKPSLEAAGPLLTCFSWSTITALSFVHPQLLHLLLQRLHQAPWRTLKCTLKPKHAHMCSWTIALNCCSWHKHSWRHFTAYFLTHLLFSGWTQDNIFGCSAFASTPKKYSFPPYILPFIWNFHPPF